MMRSWIPPPRGVLKINVDAALRSNGSFLSTVVRNACGDFIKAHFFKVITQDSMIAKLWTVRQALMICNQNG